jgi:hypothetical protein
MKNRFLEFPINWRIAKNGFRATITRFQDMASTSSSDDLFVYLPYDRSLDVLAVRNWLHDENNNSAGYDLIGCYQVDAKHRTVLTGLKIAFSRIIDAVYFRIFSSVLLGHTIAY